MKNGKIKGYDYANNLIFEGEFINEKEYGKCKEYSSESRKVIFEGEYINGVKNGKCKEYDDVSGKLKFEGEYLNGEKNGICKEYDEEGEIIFEGDYSIRKNEKKIFIWE